MEEGRLQAWLRRQVWDAPAWQVFAIALALAPACFLVDIGCGLLADAYFSAMHMPNTLPVVHAEQAAVAGAGWKWISPLLLAPVLENGLCLFWLRKVFPVERWGWWKGSLCTAAIAAGFHMLAYLEPRYIAVLPGFFAMCCLMANVRRHPLGYWASVLLHAAHNALALLVLMHGTD